MIALNKAKHVLLAMIFLFVVDTIVPSTPPSNFRPVVINATAILLTWSPPQVPNGVIISYQVNYSLSGQLVTLLLDNVSNYVVSGLEEYTWYTFTISSFTRIGWGPMTSVSARTDIAGMIVIFLTPSKLLIATFAAS